MFKITGMAAAAAGVLLLSGSGCSGNKNRAAATPDPELARRPVPPSLAATPAMTTTAVASNASVRSGPAGHAPRLAIYTPRSQAEIDAIYSTPVHLAPPPRSEARSAATTLPQYGDEAITGEPAWDVPITRDWRHIVVHHSASQVGSAAIFDRAHKARGWDGLGYHFVIGNGSASGDGEVEVGYRWTQQVQGAHAGNAEYNQAGIGICLVGDFEHGGHPTARQMASLRRLVRFLQARTGVPTSEVIGHGNVPGKNTECPGHNLDLAAFRKSLGNGAFGVNVHIARNTPAPAPQAVQSRLASSSSLP